MQDYCDLPHASKLKLQEQPYNFIEQANVTAILNLHVVHLSSAQGS